MDSVCLKGLWPFCWTNMPAIGWHVMLQRYKVGRTFKKSPCNKKALGEGCWSPA